MDQPTTDPEGAAGPGNDTALVTDAADDHGGRRQRRQRRHRSGAWHALEWVILIGAALAIAILIKTFLFQAFYIPSASMVPTLKEHDRVLVNKLSYKLHDVHRGDIVVFTKPEGEQTEIHDLVKRVVALPGETVEGRDGHIYIDGKLLKEPYLHQAAVGAPFSAQTLGDDEVWVMGDNRAESRDSRYFGPIKEDTIVGRVFVRIWPLSRIGFL